MTKLLETIDLVTNFYTYEGVVKALNKVSLAVERGSTYGLVGESVCHGYWRPVSLLLNSKI